MDLYSQHIENQPKLWDNWSQSWKGPGPKAQTRLVECMRRQNL